MGIISILLIAIGLAMDATAVSLTIGINSNENNKLSMALKSGLTFGSFQGLMPLIGWLLGIKFTSYIEKVDHWIAFALLVFIGGKMFVEGVRNNQDEEESKDYSAKRFVLLAIATSIDALAIGVSFAFLNVNILSAVSIIGITTFILSIIAVYLGQILGSIFKSKAEILGGVILIFMGSKILVDHLFL